MNFGRGGVIVSCSQGSRLGSWRRRGLSATGFVGAQGAGVMDLVWYRFVVCVVICSTSKKVVGCFLMLLCLFAGEPGSYMGVWTLSLRFLRRHSLCWLANYAWCWRFSLIWAISDSNSSASSICFMRNQASLPDSWNMLMCSSEYKSSWEGGSLFTRSANCL